MKAERQTVPSGPAARAGLGRSGSRTSRLLAGRYRLAEPLMEGGMGVVYRAEHVQLRRAVAIKRLKSELTQYPELVERFLQEGRVGARLSCPHVVRVLDVGFDEAHVPFLVMELLEGSDLGELLRRRGAFAPDVAIRYLMQACAGVSAAHRAGLIHRDLKPENLFLTRNDRHSEAIVKLLDFGISKDLRGQLLTQTGQEIGSPRYMAPEQLASPSTVDARADVWSLGVVLLELLTGEAAFDAPTIPDISARILDSRPPRLRSLVPNAPACLERVLDKCLRRQASRRYQTVTDLQSALALVCELEYPAASPPRSGSDPHACRSSVEP